MSGLRRAEADSRAGAPIVGPRPAGPGEGEPDRQLDRRRRRLLHRDPRRPREPAAAPGLHVDRLRALHHASPADPDDPRSGRWARPRQDGVRPPRVTRTRRIGVRTVGRGFGWAGSVTVVTETTGGGSTSVPTRLLVFGMAHPDGTVHAAELFPVAEACGVIGRPGPQLPAPDGRRGAASTARASGRTARYLPTEAGPRAQAAFLERTRLAYAQDLAGRGWDRHWHLVAFGIPEAKRAARDAPARPPARPRRRRHPQRPLRVAPPVGGRGRRAGRRARRARLRDPRRHRRARGRGRTGPPGAGRPARGPSTTSPTATRPSSTSTSTSPRYLESLRSRREHLDRRGLPLRRPDGDRRVPVDLQRRPAAPARAPPPPLARPRRPRPPPAQPPPGPAAPHHQHRPALFGPTTS